MLRIALPNKGTLAEPAATMMREAGYRQRNDSRDLSMLDEENDIEFFYFSPPEKGQAPVPLDEGGFFDLTTTDIAALAAAGGFLSKDVEILKRPIDDDLSRWRRAGQFLEHRLGQDQNPFDDQHLLRRDVVRLIRLARVRREVVHRHLDGRSFREHVEVTVLDPSDGSASIDSRVSMTCLASDTAIVRCLATVIPCAVAPSVLSRPSSAPTTTSPLPISPTS